MEDSRRRGRRTLIMVGAMFLVPVLVAATMYFTQAWKPSGSSSKGELITPPRTLSFAGLRNVDGTPAGETALLRKWSVVYVGDGACDADCRSALLHARQTRLALNNEMTRVQNVLLATANCCATAELQGVIPGIVLFDASAAAALIEQFPPQARANSLFIVDPLGNLMMRHDASVTSKDLLSDLKKLLKLSHIG